VGFKDHAPGSLLVEEAGGVISDYLGRPLDFGLGRTLGRNFGVVAARKEAHAQVIEAVQAVLAESAAAQGEGKESTAVRFPRFARSGSLSPCPLSPVNIQ
jgi:hypothetical protein